MAVLTKCVYGFETNPKKTPFGLINNQVRGDSIIQSAGWFNQKGERLGAGDLSLKDMQNISKNISVAEAFFVLPELDASWDIPSHLDRSAPGFNYIVQKATWAIMKGSGGGTIIRIRDDIEKTENVERDGVHFTRVARTNFCKIFGYDTNGKKLPPKEKSVLQKKLESQDDNKDVAKPKLTVASGKLPAAPKLFTPSSGIKVPAPSSGKVKTLTRKISTAKVPTSTTVKDPGGLKPVAPAPFSITKPKPKTVSKPAP